MLVSFVVDSYLHDATLIRLEAIEAAVRYESIIRNALC